MADDAEATTTPADDGRAHVNPDGTVDTGGRPAWVWCQDDDTAHRFDVLGDRLPRKGITPVEGYPLHFDAIARDGKPRHEWQAAETPAESAAPEQATSGDQGVAERATPVGDAPVVEAGNGDDQAADQPAGANTKQNGRPRR